MRFRPLTLFTRGALVLALVTAPSHVFAALGGTVASVDADRVHAQGALTRIVTSNGYALHEMRAATGTTVRQYVNSSGTVFAVAWQGPWMPDLRQVFGDRFDQYQTAIKSQRHTRTARGVLLINQPDLVVEMSGHARAFVGRAYVPTLLPQSVQLDAIR